MKSITDVEFGKYPRYRYFGVYDVKVTAVTFFGAVVAVTLPPLSGTATRGEATEVLSTPERFDYIAPPDIFLLAPQANSQFRKEMHSAVKVNQIQINAVK